MKRILIVNQKLKKRTQVVEQEKEKQPQNKIKIFDYLNKDTKRNRR